jgi:Ran GTPase-activating protein (RanGAP) involved in mRNA processing and transport
MEKESLTNPPKVIDLFRSHSATGIKKSKGSIKLRPNKKVNGFANEVENAIDKQEEKELEEKIEMFRKNEEENLGFKGNTREYIISLFSKPLFAELFFAWSKDCEDNISVENAKFFREELLMRENKDDKNFNFKSMRVSKNFLVAFAGNIISPTISKLDLSDNLISDICLHNIKSLISNKKIAHLNLSSNMISTEGLKIIHNDIINSDSLSYLNLGIFEGSFRRNNFSGDGGLIIARILLTNESLKTLILQDNELGEDSGDKIGSALIQNKTLKKLKISENKIKNKGAKSIIENGERLVSIDLSNNDITPDICFDIQKLLLTSKNLEELVWDSNNIGLKGIRIILEGVQSSKSLKKISLQNTNIGNTGVKIIAEGLIGNQVLEELDVSSNSITIEGFIPLCDALLSNQIKIFKCKNNLLGDDSMKYFSSTVLSSDDKNQNFNQSNINNLSLKQAKSSYIDMIKPTDRNNKIKIEQFDFSSSKIYDQGLIYLIFKLKDNTTITSVNLKDNYFTHEVDVLLIEYLDQNKTITNLNLEKNRLSVLCMNKLNEIIERNRKIHTDREPNRLLVEVYRLRYENTKLDEMKDSLRYVENNVEKIKLNKNDIRQEFENFKRTCDEEYEQLNKKLLKNNQNLEKVIKDKDSIIQELSFIREKNDLKVKELSNKKEEVLLKKQLLIQEIEQQKKKFIEDESTFIVTYDKLRTETFENQEKIKFYNDTNKLFQSIKEAEKKIKELKKQGKIIE